MNIYNEYLKKPMAFLELRTFDHKTWCVSLFLTLNKTNKVFFFKLLLVFFLINIMLFTVQTECCLFVVVEAVKAIQTVDFIQMTFNQITQ